ncbi:MAG: hypothetical protein HY069_04145 [Chlamydiia bacterium]|nr:hypothetical protein [Chlamydiia bacterium]
MRLWIFLFTLSSLHAAYVGNPASAAIMNTGIFSMQNPFFKGTTGYILDYVENKRYVLSDGNPAADPKFRKFSIHTQNASASLILLERIELYGTAGGSKQNANPINSQDFLVNFHGTYQFSWGTGAKIVLLQWGKTYFCTDVAYFTIPSSPKSFFKFLNRLNLELDMNKQPFRLREWQIAGALASKFYFVTPYVGALYLHSHLHVHSGPDISAIDYYNERKWGLFYGLTLSITGRLHLNFERRVANEFAYGFSTTAVF